MLLSADQPTSSGSRQNLENLPWKKVQLLTACPPAIRVGNSLFRSSLFWSRQSLKKSDCELLALVALYKKVTCERMIEFPTLPATTVTHAEVGARQYCRDNVTLSSGHKVVVIATLLYLLWQDTPSRHRDLIMFRIFSGLWGSITLSCIRIVALSLSRS